MNQFFKETPGDKKIRIATSITVVILALSAGVLSYDALRTLAVDAGIHPILALLFPITVDGLILSGSLLMLFFANKGKRSAYGFFLTALGVVLSIAGNVAVSTPTLTSQLVHATAPVVLFLSLEALTILLRWKSRVIQENNRLLQEEEEKSAEKEKQAEVERIRLEEDRTIQEELIRNAADQPEEDDKEDEQEIPMSTQIPHPLDAPRPAIAPSASSEPLLGLEPAKTTPEPPKAVPDAPSTSQTTSSANTPSYWEAKHSIPEEAPVVPSRKLESSLASTKKVKQEPTVKRTSGKAPKTAREQISDILDAQPSVSVDHIADSVEGERKYIRKLAREEIGKRAKAA